VAWAPKSLHDAKLEAENQKLKQENAEMKQSPHDRETAQFKLNQTSVVSFPCPSQFHVQAHPLLGLQPHWTSCLGIFLDGTKKIGE